MPQVILSEPMNTVWKENSMKEKELSFKLATRDPAFSKMLDHQLAGTWSFTPARQKPNETNRVNYVHPIPGYCGHRPDFWVRNPAPPETPAPVGFGSGFSDLALVPLDGRSHYLRASQPQVPSAVPSSPPQSAAHSSRPSGRSILSRTASAPGGVLADSGIKEAEVLNLEETLAEAPEERKHRHHRHKRRSRRSHSKKRDDSKYMI
eukprot:TRINITY_DN12494_c0_g1_i1.p1 TRINITY_DN12494_c0_g1~~TRINITY_DN12494_c0_g1_i1.p1  ORF type:complete len:234 (+),score=33.77 TRINITY_DN12494_c0_g1_i1:86-703(+)